MDEACENCGTALQGEFCHRCGQLGRPSVRGLGAIMADFFQDIASWDSRFWRTMMPLLFRPGFLSLEYVRGHRASYVPPIRLYLFISIAFFLVLAIVGQVDSNAMREGLAPSGPVVTQDGQPAEPRRLSDGMTLNLPFLDEAGEAEFKRRIDRLGQNPELFLRQMRTLAPTMMFILLPVFAFVLKIFYIYKPRFYVEHLVLAVHTHAFLFLAFMLIIGLWSSSMALSGLPLAPVTTGLIAWVIVALWVWCPVYLYLSQKRFYGQGWFLTTVKFLLTGFTYFLMMVIFAVGLTIASVMTA